MALEHGDLFFVNRAGATYKIEAIELGDYLTTNPLPGGEYIINNGVLNIGNTGNDALVAPVGIHSANTADDSLLDFDKYFVVQKVGSGASVTLNFMEIKQDIVCDDGIGSGFKQDSCDCLALDFETISNEIVCPDGGLVNDNGCIEINICNNSILDLKAPDSCLDVNICDPALSTDGGCLSVNIDQIASDLPCKDSGIILDGDCLALDYGKIISSMGLGLLTSADNSVIFAGKGATAGGGDLTVGNVDLTVNSTVVGGPPPGDGKLKLTAGTGITINRTGGNQFGANQTTGSDVEWTINATGGGGSSTPINSLTTPADGAIRLTPSHGNLQTSNVDVSLCLANNGGLMFNPGNGCLKLDLCAGKGLHFDNGCVGVDPAQCPKWPSQQITGQKIVATGPGTGAQPAMILNASSAGLGWIGFKTNTGSMGLAVTAGDEYIEDDCGGRTDKTSDEHRFKLFEVIPGIKGTSTPTMFRTRGVAEIGSSNLATVRCFAVDEDGDSQVGGPPTDDTLNRFVYDKNHFRLGELPEITRAADARVDIDIDQALEAIGGYSDDPTTSGGLLRWGLKEVPQSDTLETPLRFPHCYIDAEELAQVLPAFVRYYAPNSSFTPTHTYEKDEDGNDTDEIAFTKWDMKEDTTVDDLLPMEVNEQALFGLALAGLLKYKKRSEDLQSQLDAVVARLDAANIP